MKILHEYFQHQIFIGFQPLSSTFFYLAIVNPDVDADATGTLWKLV